MKMALQYNDRVVQARCLCVFADIHRNRGDNEVNIIAWLSRVGRGKHGLGILRQCQ